MGATFVHLMQQYRGSPPAFAREILLPALRKGVLEPMPEYVLRKLKREADSPITNICFQNKEGRGVSVCVKQVYKEGAKPKHGIRLGNGAMRVKLSRDDFNLGIAKFGCENTAHDTGTVSVLMRFPLWVLDAFAPAGERRQNTAYVDIGASAWDELNRFREFGNFLRDFDALVNVASRRESNESMRRRTKLSEGAYSFFPFYRNRIGLVESVLAGGIGDICALLPREFGIAGENMRRRADDFARIAAGIDEKAKGFIMALIRSTGAEKNAHTSPAQPPAAAAHENT